MLIRLILAARASYHHKMNLDFPLAWRLALLVCSVLPSGWVQAQSELFDQVPATPRFPIVRFEVSGNTLLSEAEIQRRTAPFLGPRQDFADVQRALEALEEAYRQAGWGSVQVILPEQTLTSGVVHLRVIESRIAKVTVAGAHHHTEANIRRSVPQLREGEVPRLGELQESLRLGNENPSKHAALVLKAGEREEALEAELRVVDYAPERLIVTLDNTGNPSTGETRFGLGYQHANLFDRDHVLNVQWQTSPSKPGQVRIWGLGYRVPLYDSGDVIDLAYGDSNVNAGTLLDLFSVSGAGKVFSARYTFNFPRWSGGWEPRLAAAFDWRAYRNKVEYLATGQRLLPDLTVRPLSLTASLIRRAEGGESAAHLTWVRNLPGGSQGDAAAFAATRQGARADYQLWRYGLSHLGELGSAWQWRVSVNGQWTRDALVPGEQFGIGGMDSVRGFRERELAADRGQRLSGEFYTPDWGPALGQGLGLDGLRLRLLTFYDRARIGRNHALPGELTTQRIAAWGVGLRAGLGRRMSLRLDYGRVLEAGGSQGKGDGRLAASFAWQF